MHITVTETGDIVIHGSKHVDAYLRRMDLGRGIEAIAGVLARVVLRRPQEARKLARIARRMKARTVQDWTTVAAMVDEPEEVVTEVVTATKAKAAFPYSLDIEGEETAKTADKVHVRVVLSDARGREDSRSTVLAPRGWSARAPKTLAERRQTAEVCGRRRCFLRPGSLGYPICVRAQARALPCAIDCGGLLAAYRAARGGRGATPDPRVARAAVALAVQHGCSWTLRRK